MKTKASLILGVIFTLSAIAIAISNPGPELPFGLDVLYTVLLITGPGLIVMGVVSREVKNHRADTNRMSRFV